MHLTKLDDFKALNAGTSSIEFTPERGGASTVLRGSAPSRPGAFRVEGTPPAGLQRVSDVAGSLLLNLEAGFTMALAVSFFGNRLVFNSRRPDVNKTKRVCPVLIVVTAGARPSHLEAAAGLGEPARFGAWSPLTFGRTEV